MWTCRPGSMRTRGAADHLPVAQDAFARADRRQRDFVARGHRVFDPNRAAIHAQFLPGRKRHARDGHVVGRVQMNGRVLGGRKLRDFEQAHGGPLQIY